MKNFSFSLSRILIKFHKNSLISPSAKEIPENSRFSIFFHGVDTLNPSLLNRYSSNRQYIHRQTISRATHQSHRVLRDRDHAQLVKKKTSFYTRWNFRLPSKGRKVARKLACHISTFPAISCVRRILRMTRRGLNVIRYTIIRYGNLSYTRCEEIAKTTHCRRVLIERRQTMIIAIKFKPIARVESRRNYFVTRRDATVHFNERCVTRHLRTIIKRDNIGK